MYINWKQILANFSNQQCKRIEPVTLHTMIKSQDIANWPDSNPETTFGKACAWRNWCFVSFSFFVIKTLTLKFSKILMKSDHNLLLIRFKAVDKMCFILPAWTTGLPDFPWHYIPKRGKIYQITTTLPNGIKYTKWPQNILNGHKIY
jgi:hypothetical protein